MAPPSLLLTALAAAGAASAHCQQRPRPAPNLATAPGVQVKTLLSGLSEPRGVVVDSGGNVLVVERGDDGKGVTRVVLGRGRGLGVCVESSRPLVRDAEVRAKPSTFGRRRPLAFSRAPPPPPRFLSQGPSLGADDAGHQLNHGIALSKDGKTLFASSSSDVYAWRYDAARSRVGRKRQLITGMKQGGHATRTLLVPELHPHLLLVSRGSDGNIDKGTLQVESARSQIRVFELDALFHARHPVQYSSGAVLGWGLRNSVGVDQDPSTGNIVRRAPPSRAPSRLPSPACPRRSIGVGVRKASRHRADAGTQWSLENSIDDMKRGGRDIHQSNPGDELNFHGQPDDRRSEVYGKNFGYPGCVAIYDSSNVGGYPGGAETGKQMVGDHMPRNWTDEWCQRETVAPIITFESHRAPLDMKFQDDVSAAYISMHGSW